MQLLFLFLQAARKSSLDSTFRSIDQVKTHSLLSLENPLMFSLVVIVVIMAVTFVYYRYVIIPMKKKHLEEEENLKLQQAELMALLASLSPDPIFRFDETGRINLANNSAHKIFPHKILLGEQVETVLPFIVKYNIQDIISNGLTLTQTTLLGTSHFQFIVSGVQRLGFCQVYGRDISELKIKEQELKEALVKAEESKKLKEYFLAQISHEIRSPLNVIVGFSDLLSEEFKDERKEELNSILRSIKNNSKRLYRTFDLLLNMSQIQTTKYEPRFEKVDLVSLLKLIQTDFNSLAEEKDLKLNLNNKIGEDITIMLDHYSITQVFVNLIDNAIKYTQEGSIDITIYRENTKIYVDVTDTGKGMSQDYLDRLFTPFTQEEMGYTRRYDGTGLGLAIAKSFVDINNAKIKVVSGLKKGTTFTIIFNGDNRWGILQK